MLRRGAPVGGAELCLRFDDLEIDGARSDVRYRGKSLGMTRAELKLLMVLASSTGRALSREALATQAFGHEWDAHDRTVDAHIMKLRKKLDGTAFGAAIETVFGVGYRFNPGATRDT